MDLSGDLPESSGDHKLVREREGVPLKCLHRIILLAYNVHHPLTKVDSHTHKGI